MKVKFNGIKQSSIGILVVDHNGTIKEINSKCEILFNENYSLIGKNIFELLQYQNHKLKEIFTEALSGIPYNNTNVQFGQHNISNLTIIPTLIDNNVKQVLALFTFNDIEATCDSKLNKTIAELKRLNEVIHHINSTLQMEDVLETIFTQLKEIFGFDGVCIQLKTDDGKYLRIMKICHEGVCESDLKEMENLRYEIEAANKYIKCVILEGKHSIEKDTLYLPLQVQNETIGMLSVSSFKTGLYLTDDDIDSITRYTNYISTALNNSKLHEKIATVNKELHEKNHIISQDLILAQEIQSNILPKDYLNFDKLDIIVKYIPYIEVGGDFYDIFMYKENVFRILIADATGHGVQAGFTTMLIKSEYELVKSKYDTPNLVLENFNKGFYKKYSSIGMFCTAFIIDIDLNNNKIYYSAAGHPLQLLLRDKIINLDARGPLICLSSDLKFEYEEMDIKKGDKILLFTDGLYEEFNEKNEILGEERFYSFVNSNVTLSISQIADNVFSNIYEFIGKNTPDDDMTLIAIEIK